VRDRRVLPLPARFSGVVILGAWERLRHARDERPTFSTRRLRDGAPGTFPDFIETARLWSTGSASSRDPAGVLRHDAPTRFASRRPHRRLCACGCRGAHAYESARAYLLERLRLTVAGATRIPRAVLADEYFRDPGLDAPLCGLFAADGGRHTSAVGGLAARCADFFFRHRPASLRLPSRSTRSWILRARRIGTARARSKINRAACRTRRAGSASW